MNIEDIEVGQVYSHPGIDDGGAGVISHVLIVGLAYSKVTSFADVISYIEYRQVLILPDGTIIDKNRGKADAVSVVGFTSSYLKLVTDPKEIALIKMLIL